MLRLCDRVLAASVLAMVGAAIGCGSSDGGPASCQVPAENPATLDFPDAFMLSTTDFGTPARCGYKGEATVDGMAFDGHESLVISNANDEVVCEVRWTLKRVGCAPEGCKGSTGIACEMSWLLEYSSPEMVTNVNNACANSAYQLDAAHLAKITGKRVAYGYGNTKVCVDAHGDGCRFFYSATKKAWASDAPSNATYDENTKKLTYNLSASCSYKM